MSLQTHGRSLLIFLLLVAADPGAAAGQQQPGDSSADPDRTAAGFAMLRWRNVGPDKGGRSIAVAGHRLRPHEYYFGATGGGLWKTTDGGTSWEPVTDGQIATSSVGSVAVAPSDPDIVYLGMGESQLRANVMQGDGVYRSTDAGRNWTHVGLERTRTISVIRVHPTDADTVFVAALGDPFSGGPDRGVYRTTDGGRNWQRVLGGSGFTGAVDLALDPRNPDVLFATFWEVYRKPWKLWSGGPGSAVYRSTDGGSSWRDITDNPGLPARPLGKMTVAVSPADSSRIWLNIEAADGGLYRSDDGGTRWTFVNGDRDLWQRSFYFMRLEPDPVDRDTLYVMNFLLNKTTDGGRSFELVRTPHQDIHDLWIDPDDPRRMVVADDGGGSVSVNGGQTWTAQAYPTAQIYRVATTNDFPYHICGAQQDALSICVPSRKPSSLLSPFVRQSSMSEHFDVVTGYFAGGGENGYVTPHPAKPGLFFSGATNQLDRFDRQTGQVYDVQPYPFLVMGQAAATMRERWNWVYPIVFSPLPPYPLYAGSQHLWQSDDDGLTWRRISPDLTRADPDTLADSGGPIVLDQDGPEIYGTIFTIAPSPRDRDVIWTGSDDGRIHVTKNAGRSWSDVTPTDMPEHSKVSFIDASPHDPRRVYVAAKRYQLGDRSPYLWTSDDLGRRWSRIDAGLPASEFVHAIREDPKAEGLLFIGTENGVYTSLDGGNRWHPLRLNLPAVQVPSLQVKNDDLVIATHGRSFYVLDSISAIRELARDSRSDRPRLYGAAPATRRLVPAYIDFFTPSAVESAQLVVAGNCNECGKLSRTIFAGRPLAAGAHRFVWDLRLDGARVFDGIVLEGPSPASGPWAVPGTYQVRLTLDSRVLTTTITVQKDPRLQDVDQDDLEAQLALALRIREATSTANDIVAEIRRIREKLVTRTGGKRSASNEAVDRVLTQLGEIEAELYQTKNASPKDKIAFPIKLNNRLSGLLAAVGRADGRPTSAHYDVFRGLEQELAEIVDRYRGLRQQSLIEALEQ